MKLDDGLDGHPKVLAAGLDGVGLFARALSYCGRHLTDGRVPEAWVASAIVGADPGLPQRLVDVGLWVREGAGYVIPDFCDLNPSREQVQEQRAGAKQRAAASRKRQGGKP